MVAIWLSILVKVLNERPSEHREAHSIIDKTRIYVMVKLYRSFFAGDFSHYPRNSISRTKYPSSVLESTLFSGVQTGLVARLTSEQ
jgi:hypothetical protein